METKINQIEQTKQNLLDLISNIEHASEEGKRIDQVESHIFKSLLQIGKNLLVLYIGLVKSKTEKSMHPGKENGYQNKGLVNRSYFSIFGIVEYIRRKYYVKKKVIFPLDNELGMPEGKYSYKLQDWIGHGATETDFRSSVKLLNRIFDHNFSEMQAQRIANNLSVDVEEFYDNATFPDKEEEGEYFAAGFDDKGIPILPSEVNREVDSSAERLGKGQKNGVKKSSTVSITYSFDPLVRTPEAVITSLFDKQKDKKKDEKKEQASLESNRNTKNKHIRAFISDKKKAMEYGFDNIVERCGEANKKAVVLIDGDRGLEKAVDRAIETKGITAMIMCKILDFIHVVEYIWKAANAHFGEKSPDRIAWVKQQCLLLLQSQMNTVIDNLRTIIQQHKSQPSKQAAIQKVINYIVNHKQMMDYKSYLARGFPISTGAVESACGHFVQCRMERNGMRWSLRGAQNLLNIRAVNKNDDWDKYIKHYIDNEQTLLSSSYRMAA